MSTRDIDLLSELLSIEYVEIYIFTRQGKSIRIEPWDGRARIPGFTGATSCTISVRQPGVKANRGEEESSQCQIHNLTHTLYSIHQDNYILCPPHNIRR